MKVKSTLLLPPCDKATIPTEFSSDNLLVLSKPEYATLNRWIEMFDFDNAPRVILGSENTESMAWLAATREYPNTRAMIWQASEQQWQDTQTLEIWGDESKEDVPEQAGVENDSDSEGNRHSASQKVGTQQTERNTIEKASNNHKPNPRNVKRSKLQNRGNHSRVISFQQMDDKKLLNEIFKFCAWGSEHANKVQDAKFEAGRRADTDPTMANRAVLMEELGTLANDLANQAVKRLKKRFPTQGNQALDDALAWAETQKNGKHNKVNFHVSKQLKNTFEYLEKGMQNAKHRKKNKTESIIAPVKFHDGIHPNSLRHLQTSEEWTIVIDETGENFSPNAQDLSSFDRKMGKVVALAIPKRSYSKLKDLPKAFHATDSTDEAFKDQIVQDLTQADIGVLGFSVQDRALTINQQWFDAIHKLCEWTLLMLPVREDESLKVLIQIEEKGGYVPGDGQLQLIKETLLTRLTTLAPERFRNLHLHMEFIDKNGSKFNGYVDTIANTWGSTRKLPKQRLQQSQWLNHCLLSAQQNNIQRLFLAVNENQTLTKDAWYQICGEILSEPKTSLLHTLLDQVGQKTQKNEALWVSYMDFISERLRLKDYKLSAIGYALDWLEAHKPEHVELPLIAQLYWLSAKLAQLNHEGKLDIQRLQKLIAIADTLKEEYAADCCQALLRVSTAMTNGFEFNAATPTLNKWLEYDIAIPGRLNHAKLLSTMGQLSAFNGDAEEAVDYFDQAIAEFKQLSDQKVTQKDIQQTQIYRRIASMDQLNTPNANDWQSNIITDDKQVRALAVSGSLERYQHHTFLRGLIHAPDTFSETIKNYLLHEAKWDFGDGHPWPWINAYRGWLFALQGQKNKAKEYFEIAIEQTQDEFSGVTIQWIGAVIATLADKLNVTDNKASSFDIEQLSKQLANAPIDALQTFQNERKPESHQEILARIQALVPFNFH